MYACKESKLMRSLKNETTNLIQLRKSKEKERIEDLAFQDWFQRRYRINREST